MPESEIQIEDNVGDDSEEIIPYKYSITSYGADYPVDGLVKRITEGDIYVPSFQRGYVWQFKEASRFVESLLLGLPVPSIFLAKEEETQKLLVIDGQQRLRTLQYFYSGIFEPTGREFVLRGIPSKFEGVTYKTLAEEDRRRLDDSIIHAIIVKQDEPSDDNSSIYHIFERLNTAGTQLLPQEIRSCIYHGEFNDLLKQLNMNKSWRGVYGPVSKNMRDQELILRFLALYFNAENYSRPIKAFLNDYMGKNKHLKLHSADQIRQAFVQTVEVVHNCLGAQAFRIRKVLNAAVFDAIMVGIARRLVKGDINDSNTLKKRHQDLLNDNNFLSACISHTADEESVQRRIALATAIFSDVT